MRSFRVALAQINTTVGDLQGNTDKVLTGIREAQESGADLVVFPELTISGYPPEDLLFKPKFIAENRDCLDQIVKHSKGIAAVVGVIDMDEDIYNAAAIIQDQEILGIYRKIYLPNYGVFDEKRYFRAGSRCPVFELNNVRVGVNICEDMWYALGPTTIQRQAGAEIIININGSPYHRGKDKSRERLLSTRALDNGVYVCYTNLVGGQDELVFDGCSAIFDPAGKLLIQGNQFQEDLVVADLDADNVIASHLHEPRARDDKFINPIGSGDDVPLIIGKHLVPDNRPPIKRGSGLRFSDLEQVYGALTIGTRDYVRKNGFEKVVIGLSGGIDSSLTAAVAVDALGPENVLGITMPSRYSSKGSVKDSDLLAQNLGITLWNIPIEGMFQASLDSLEKVFTNTKSGVAEENLQARMRGVLLMAISNKFGRLVLTTGNKSEMAMGYGTLYGDMAGGFAVIKDVPKTLVYELAGVRNAREQKALIPQSVIDKEPSAELRPDQKDKDSLPPYAILDPVLQAYVEQDKSVEEIIGMGFEERMVKQVVSGVDRNEYKRRQAPPGIKITPRNFGRDRRMPIVNRFRGF